MPPRRPSSYRALDLRDRAVEVIEDGCDDQAGAALGAGLAELRGPAVVRAGTGEQVLGIACRHRVEAGAERRAHAAGGGVGPWEHDFTGDAVVVELLVALRCIPRAPHADLVEAVALVVLAEPLLLEPVVTGEGIHAGRGTSLVDERLAFHQLRVEVLAVPRIEEVAVDGRVGTRVAVGRDDHVVLHGAPPGI